MKKQRILFLLLLISLGPLFCQEASFTISTSYNNLLSNPRQEGMLDRIMLELFGRLGIPCSLIYLPTEQSLIDVNTGILDAEINRVEGMEALYPHLVRVEEANMTMYFVAFSKREYPIDGWESIRNLEIGIVRGWKILEENTRDFPHITLVPTEAELFNMLRKDRIDIALYSKLVGYATLKDMKISGIFHLEPPLAERDMYLYVHDSRKDLVPDIAKTLKTMKTDGTYSQIVDETLEYYLPEYE